MNSSTHHPLTVARRRAGLSVRKLGALADVSYVTVSHIENGRVNPQGGTLRKLADALTFAAGRKVSVEQLGGDEPARRRSRLSKAQRQELIKQHGWSLQPSDEYGGFSEADYNLAYMNEDPADWQPLVVVADGQVTTEQAPPWFLQRVQKAQGSVPSPALRVMVPAARPRARRRRNGSSKRSSSRGSPDGSDDGPGEPAPAKRRRRA